MDTHLLNAAELPESVQQFFGMLGALAERDAEDDLIRRTYGIQIKADSLDEETRSAEFVCSTEAVDSYDEIVAQDWDLSRYQQNPVVLYGHNRASGFFGSVSQTETLPIGQAENVRVENGQLVARLLFATSEANPFAEQVWQSIRQRTLRAVSVGFRSNDLNEEDGIVTLAKNELYEISVVPLPANAEAVIRNADGTASGMRDHHRAQIARLIAKQQTTGERAHTPAADSPPAPSGLDSTPMETDMDPKELQAEIEALKATNAELQTKADELAEKLEDESETLTEANEQLEELNAKVAELTTERDAVTGERDELKVRVDAVELENATAFVASFVGKKITKAEAEYALEDYQRLGREEFEKRMNSRADLPHTQGVIGPDPKPENEAATGKSASARVAEKASNTAATQAARA